MGTYKDILILVDKVTSPLAKINNKMEEMNKKTDKVKARFAKFNDKINILADKSRNAIKVVGNLTTAFVGLAGASGAIAMGINKAAQYGDRIDKMSQKIGMSQKAFQEWDYIMSQNGGNVESLQMGFKTLTQQIKGVQSGSKSSVKAFAALGVKVKNSTGKFRDQNDIFNDTIRALQKIKNPTQKAMLANQLFGRSAAELKPLLNQDADAIDNLRNKANKLGLVMSPEDVKNAVEFTDTIDTLGRFFQSRINQAVTKIMPKLVKTFEKLMEFRAPIDAIFKGLGKVAEITFKFIEFLTKHWEILIGIGAALAAVAAPAIYAAIVAGIGAVEAAIVSGALAANVAMAGIPILIGALVAGAAWLVRNWEKVSEGAKEMGAKIAQVWSSLVEKFKGWIGNLIEWADALLERLGFLAYLIPGLQGIKIGKAIAGAVGERINNNSVHQSSIQTTNYYNTKTDNHYGNTYNGTTSGFFFNSAYAS